MSEMTLRQSYVQRLRNMADLMERHEFLNIYDAHSFGFSVYVYDGDENEPKAAERIAQWARELRADKLALREPAIKDYETTQFTLTVKMELFTVKFRTSRDSVCVAKVVGTETVEEIDYSQAPKKMVERDVIEWECAPILNDNDNG